MRLVGCIQLLVLIHSWSIWFKSGRIKEDLRQWVIKILFILQIICWWSVGISCLGDSFANWTSPLIASQKSLTRSYTSSTTSRRDRLWNGSGRLLWRLIFSTASQIHLLIGWIQIISQSAWFLTRIIGVAV